MSNSPWKDWKKFNSKASSPVVDGSDAKGNSGFTVSFQHVPSGESLYFKAFLTSFNETFASDWQNESIYGRADVTGIYKNTQRKVSVGLMIPATSIEEGTLNLAKVGKLVQFLYPTYAEIGNPSARIITQSPLVRLKVMNLLTAMPATTIDAMGTNTIDELKTKTLTTLLNSNDAKDGILGAMMGLMVNHNVDNPDLGSFEVGKGTIIPKAIEIQFDFQVLHEHHLGWKGQNSVMGDYPYQANVKKATSEAARAPAASEINRQMTLLARQNQAAIDNSLVQLSYTAARDTLLSKMEELQTTLNNNVNSANAEAIRRANSTDVITGPPDSEDSEE